MKSLNVDQIVSGLVRRFVLAGAILAVLAASGYGIGIAAIAEEEASAELINLSGRQRMLSQRTTMFALQLASRETHTEGFDRGPMTFEFVKTINLLETSHVTLSNGDSTLGIPGPQSEVLRGMYFGPTGEVDSQVNRFISHARLFAKDSAEAQNPNNPHLIYIATEASGRLLQALDAVVTQYEIESDERVERLKFFEHVVLGLTLTTLLILAWFLIRPVIQKVRLGFEERLIIEEELKEQTTLAEAASDSKSLFLANMSHEIRTPLNAIIGLTGLALKTPLDDRQTDYLSKVSSSSRNLLGIINDILDFSKIEAGKLDVETIEFQLNSVMTDIGVMMSDRIGEKPVEILFRTDPEVPLDLVGDPLRLGQILINLINNAIKFTSEGEIVVSVKFLSLENDRVRLRFEVADTGIGMTENEVAKLFQPFVQADVSTTRKFGGTGLGLAICQRLSSLMGGEIGAESQKEQGSTFWFTVEFQRSAAHGLKKHMPRPNLRGLRVLVVDDNETARIVYSETLAAMSFKTKAVASGREAINELSALANNKAMPPYDLMLMDWHMPELDGIETIKKFKRENGAIELPPIVMVTAHGREEVREMAENSGISAFLVKPINQSMLLDTISEVFMRKQLSGAAVLPMHCAPDKPTASDTSLVGASVLLVEDNEINQQVACEILENAGMKVDVAENGRIALERVGARNYDAVLMDLQMPVMDGYAATEAIRNGRRFDDLPIIAMTAHAMTAERDRCLAVGMNDHVTKPVDPDRLFEALEKWINPAPRRYNQLAEVTGTPQCSLKPNAPATPSKPVSPNSLPDEIDGINVPDARKIVNGNDTLLRRLLSSFHGTYMDRAELIANAVIAGDIETAANQAHSLKGVSGNVGAGAVFEAASKVEAQLRADPKDAALQRLLVDLTAALYEVDQGLSKALSSTP